MVALFAIVPVYLFIGDLASGWTVHAPEMALDRALPLAPSWAMVYLSLFLAALLPVFVVHQQALIRRVILAYLSVWLVSYAFFLTYPTIAPQHEEVTGKGFSALALQTIYEADVQYNCFPSLHVAQCFLAALACYCVHRGVGLVTGLWASLVGLSTLYTKQHYVVDVIAGAFLAYAAYLVFLRGYPRDAIPKLERRLAPVLALGAFGVYGLMVAGLWLLYAINNA
jgi:membrane-associated phospholipid phosphatase